MKNFYSYNPTKIIFGRGMIANMSKEIPTGSKVLMMYGGGSIKKNRVYEQVIAALKGCEVVEFPGVEPNPEYETCKRAITVAREKKIDLVLAVGGGSVMDSAKFVAWARFLPSSDEPWDLLTKKIAAPAQALPVGCVVTRPGTGSDMNSGFVINRKKTREKLPANSILLYPRFSVLDPEATMSLSAQQTAVGIVDMFVHVLEQYVTTDSEPSLQSRQAEALLLTMREHGPALLKDLNNYDLRASIMWCAAQALNGTLSRGVPTDWATHGIGHEITALYGVEHARTLAIVLGGVWRHRFEQKKERLAQYGKRVWELNGDPEKTAKAAIEKTEAFFEGLGVPTRLSAYGLKASEVAQAVSKRFAERGDKLGEDGSIGSEHINSILLLRD